MKVRDILDWLEMMPSDYEVRLVDLDGYGTPETHRLDNIDEPQEDKENKIVWLVSHNLGNRDTRPPEEVNERWERR